MRSIARTVVCVLERNTAVTNPGIVAVFGESEHFARMLCAVALVAQRGQIEGQLVAEPLVGEVVNLEHSFIAAAFAPSAGTRQNGFPLLPPVAAE